MRVNVYEEELTNDIQIVQTKPIPQPDDTEKVFYGVRWFLKSAQELHHTEVDDDRSAITIWVGSYERALALSGAIYNNSAG